MTTTIRGNSGKKALRDLLQQHDDANALIDQCTSMVEPLSVQGISIASGSIEISRDELRGILQARLALINTKLENLGLKIGDDIADSATPNA